MDHGAEQQAKLQLEEMSVLEELLAWDRLGESINKLVQLAKLLLNIVNLEQLFEKLVLVLFLRGHLGGLGSLLLRVNTLVLLC